MEIAWSDILGGGLGINYFFPNEPLPYPNLCVCTYETPGFQVCIHTVDIVRPLPVFPILLPVLPILLFTLLLLLPFLILLVPSSPRPL